MFGTCVNPNAYIDLGLPIKYEFFRPFGGVKNASLSHMLESVSKDSTTKNAPQNGAFLMCLKDAIYLVFTGLARL